MQRRLLEVEVHTLLAVVVRTLLGLGQHLAAGLHELLAVVVRTFLGPELYLLPEAAPYTVLVVVARRVLVVHTLLAWFPEAAHLPPWVVERSLPVLAMHIRLPHRGWLEEVSRLAGGDVHATAQEVHSGHWVAAAEDSSNSMRVQGTTHAEAEGRLEVGRRGLPVPKWLQVERALEQLG